ncbi:hypothetical protein ACVI1J_005868 [Bradyrhizobium diazoefficiens]
MTTRLDLLGITGLAPRRMISPRSLSHHTLCRRGARSWVARAPGHREPQRYRHPGLESDAGRPAGRADRSAHGFLSCGLRASGRLLDCAPPFSAGGTPVSFNRGRVERQYDAVFARLGQRFEDCAPSSSLGPAIEAIVDRRVRAVFTWTITPSCTRLQHVNDAADDASVVVPIRPRQSPRQMRFDTRPLPVVQPKQTSAHSLAPESTRRQENHVALFRYRP